MQITLNWNPPAVNSSGQDVQYKKIGDVEWTTHQTVGAAVSTVTITGLDDNYIYQFRVINNCIYGGPTPSASTENMAFTCPVVTLTSVTINQVDYSFPHLGGDVTSYDVKLYASDGTTVLATNNVPAPGATVTGSFAGLSNSTAYKIRVIPYATGSLGTYSKTNCALTNANTPAPPSCSAPTGVTATIS